MYVNAALFQPPVGNDGGGDCGFLSAAHQMVMASTGSLEVAHEVKAKCLLKLTEYGVTLHEDLAPRELQAAIKNVASILRKETSRAVLEKEVEMVQISGDVASLQDDDRMLGARDGSNLEQHFGALAQDGVSVDWDAMAVLSEILKIPIVIYQVGFLLQKRKTTCERATNTTVFKIMSELGAMSAGSMAPASLETAFHLLYTPPPPLIRNGVGHFEALLPAKVPESSAPALQNTSASCGAASVNKVTSADVVCNVSQLVRSRKNQLKALAKLERKLQTEIEEREEQLRSLAQRKLDAETFLAYYESMEPGTPVGTTGAALEQRDAGPKTPVPTNAEAALLPPPWAPLKTQDGFGGVEGLVIRGNKVIRRFRSEVRCETAQDDDVFSSLTPIEPNALDWFSLENNEHSACTIVPQALEFPQDDEASTLEQGFETVAAEQTRVGV